MGMIAVNVILVQIYCSKLHSANIYLPRPDQHHFWWSFDGLVVQLAYQNNTSCTPVVYLCDSIAFRVIGTHNRIGYL